MREEAKQETHEWAEKMRKSQEAHALVGNIRVDGEASRTENASQPAIPDLTSNRWTAKDARLGLLTVRKRNQEINQQTEKKIHEKRLLGLDIASFLGRMRISISGASDMVKFAYETCSRILVESGRDKTPEMLQDIFEKEILPIIKGRTNGIGQEVQDRLAAAGLGENSPVAKGAKNYLDRQMTVLESEWRGEIEREKLDLENRLLARKGSSSSRGESVQKPDQPPQPQSAPQYIEKRHFVEGTSIVDFLGVVHRNVPPLGSNWGGFAKELFLSKLDFFEGELKRQLAVETRDSLEVVAAWAMELGQVLDYRTSPSPFEWVNVRVTYLKYLGDAVYGQARQVWEQDQSQEKTEGFCRGVFDYLILPILTERRVRFRESFESIRKVLPLWQSGSECEWAADTLSEESEAVLNKLWLKTDIEARVCETRKTHRIHKQEKAEGAMETTAFWRDLEDRFRALHQEQLQHPGQGALCALWDGQKWHLGDGYAEDRVSRNFERLAKSAVVRLSHAGGTTAVSFWLDLLKAKSGSYLPFEPKGGRIELVCKVSADYCLECETQEIVQRRTPESVASAMLAKTEAEKPARPLSAERVNGSKTGQLISNQNLGMNENYKPRRERGPNIKISQERVDLEDKLRSELGAIAIELGHSPTLEQLKKKFPDYNLWSILSGEEQELLITEEFKPRAYARTLVMRKDGLTNPETIKKDRQKVRRAAKSK